MSLITEAQSCPSLAGFFFLIRMQIRRQKFSNRGNTFESILYVIQMNLFTKQKQTHKHRKQLIVAKGERGKGRDTLGL